MNHRRYKKSQDRTKKCVSSKLHSSRAVVLTEAIYMLSSTWYCSVLSKLIYLGLSNLSNKSTDRAIRKHQQIINIKYEIQMSNSVYILHFLNAVALKCSPIQSNGFHNHFMINGELHGFWEAHLPSFFCFACYLVRGTMCNPKFIQE